MKKIENILEDCINRIASGEAPEKILPDYPENADELKRLLEAAGFFESAPVISPSSGFEKRLYDSFKQAFVAETKRGREKALSPFRLVFAKRVFAYGFAMFSLLGGIAYASQDALPGEALYPVKRTLEKVSLIVTTGDSSAVAGLKIEQAGKRLEEARAIEDDDPALSRETLGQAIDSLNKVLEGKPSETARETITGLIEKMTEKQEAILDKKAGKDRDEVPDEPVIKKYDPEDSEASEKEKDEDEEENDNGKNGSEQKNGNGKK